MSPTSAAIGVVAEAFGFAQATVNNYHSRLLYEIDTSTLQALVLGNQRSFREGIADLKFQTKPAVEHALRSYLRICMPFSIETEVNNVLTVVNRSGEIRRSADHTDTVEAAVDATKPRTAEQRVTVVQGHATATDRRVAGSEEDLCHRQLWRQRSHDAATGPVCAADELGTVGPRTPVGLSRSSRPM